VSHEVAVAVAVSVGESTSALADEYTRCFGVFNSFRQQRASF
jgi:hypothetical protein